MKRIDRRIVVWLMWLLMAALILSPPAASQTLQSEPLALIPQAVEEALLAGETPGAVVMIGHQGKIVFQHAFGYRDRKLQPMSTDTLFDIASLTKVVATTPAVLQLVEKGNLKLDDPVAKYWPEFKGHDKGRITVRQLLTHYSGLRPGLPMKSPWSGYEAALKKIIDEKPLCPPDSRFTYSDLNFIILGEIVRQVSREPLDTYCRRHIFEPMGMKDTCFKPPRSLHGRLAPTMEGSLGVVHDPVCRRMGGVAGHAGLFSTAQDLGLFAQVILEGGRLPGGHILSPHTVEHMVLPQSPAAKRPSRGLGWAIRSTSGNWSQMLPPGSFGHKGYTGSLIWIDPETQTYLIILGNRVYPDGEGREETLRDRVFSLVVQATGRTLPASSSNLSHGGDQPAAGGSRSRVMTGADVLMGQRLAPLAGKRVGLIINHTGLDSQGRHTTHLLAKATEVKLKAIFTPEHGLSGQEEGKVFSGRDQATNLPVYSLYGDTLRPKSEMLKGIDALVFHVQDAGVRFYTYMTTMAYAMESAAKKGIPFFVLDRPNPINASRVEGPVMDRDLKSFTGYFPLPVRHGMTLGELAKMFNKENRMGVELTVIPMKGYRRGLWFDETGLRWVNPSPNLRSLTQAILYPGIALAEASNVSVGRGTETPFELFGAPWIQAKELSDYLNDRKIAGVEFQPATFVPVSGCYKGHTCNGVRIVLKDRNGLDSVMLGVEVLSALCRLYPKLFEIDSALSMIGSRSTLQAIKRGQDPQSIVSAWWEPLQEFKQMRANYLLYPGED